MCDRSKGRVDHHKKQTLRMLAVQIDYNFASTHHGINRSTLFACDVIPGLVMCIVVPSKEVSHYHAAALTNFLVETGRLGAVLQGDREVAIRAFITRVCSEMRGLKQALHSTLQLSVTWKRWVGAEPSVRPDTCT